MVGVIGVPSPPSSHPREKPRGPESFIVYVNPQTEIGVRTTSEGRKTPGFTRLFFFGGGGKEMDWGEGR